MLIVPVPLHNVVTPIPVVPRRADVQRRFALQIFVLLAPVVLLPSGCHDRGQASQDGEEGRGHEEGKARNPSRNAKTIRRPMGFLVD